ncbi:methyltransferase family protein [Chloroflexota bacterium]
MSLIPAFEIGLWNAWIFTFYILFLLFLPTLINKFNKGATRKREIFIRMSSDVSRSKAEKVCGFFSYGFFSWLIFFLLYIYSIFLPLQSGTKWFYIGLPICLFGVITFTMVMVSFISTPLDKPITTGLYRYSRHPMYLTLFLTYLGISIATASWIFLLWWLVYPIQVLSRIIYEERFCLKKYGKVYRQYMNTTPRWIGILKSRDN